MWVDVFQKVKVLFANLQNGDFLDGKVTQMNLAIKHCYRKSLLLTWDGSNNILLNIEQTETSLFRTSNGFEQVRHLVIQLKQPIFGFKQSNIVLFNKVRPITTSNYLND